MKRLKLIVLIIVLLFVLYQSICFIFTKSCISRAKNRKEGIEILEDTDDVLWNAQYHKGSNDSSSVEVIILPTLTFLWKNEGRGYMSVIYKYYDDSGELIKKSGPESEVFYYIKKAGKWELYKIYRPV